MSHTYCCGTPWAKYGVLAFVIVGGAAGGLYLSSGWSDQAAAPVVQRDPDAKMVPRSATTQRFALTSFDVKDQTEAPAVAADSNGRIYLVWSSQMSDSEKRLNFSRTDDEGKFAVATTIARTGIVKFPAQMKGKPITRDSRLMPHVAVANGAVHLAWTEALPDLSGIRMVLAASTDDGATFGPPLRVHQSAIARPTYTAMAVSADGAISCSWLDNRDNVQQAVAAVREAGKATFSMETLIHAGDGGRGVCPCCPTSEAIDADGTVYVAFRNIEDGFRDIAISRKKRGETKFDGPFPVIPPTWKFDGCPHDGASMAIVGDVLHIVWMDARSGSQRCYYGWSKTSDLKFETHELNPVIEGTQGNAKIHADRSGRLHLVWEQSVGSALADDSKHRHGPPQTGAGGGRAIMYATLSPGSDRFSSPRAVVAKEGVFQTRPTVTSKGSEIFVAWNELDESGKAIVVAKVDLAGERP